MIKTILSLTLAIYLVLAGFCSGAANFAQQVANILDKYPDLLTSLNLPIDLNNEVTKDFKDLALAGNILSTDFQAIPKGDPQSRPKHLAAINKFSDAADAIFDRGHFETNSKLRGVKMALKGVVMAAKIYYSPIFGANAEAQKKTNEAQLKSKIKDLKLAMQP